MFTSPRSFPLLLSSSVAPAFGGAWGCSLPCAHLRASPCWAAYHSFSPWGPYHSFSPSWWCPPGQQHNPLVYQPPLSALDHHHKRFIWKMAFQSQKFTNSWTVENSLENARAELRILESSCREKTVHTTFLTTEGHRKDILCYIPEYVPYNCWLCIKENFWWLSRNIL